MIIKGEAITLSGDIGPPDFYDGTLTGSGSFQGELGVYLTTGSKTRTYDGETVVVPRASSDVVLPTKDTLVADDITVKKVPAYRTENTSGGNTVYIASEQ